MNGPTPESVLTEAVPLFSPQVVVAEAGANAIDEDAPTVALDCAEHPPLPVAVTV